MSHIHGLLCTWLLVYREILKVYRMYKIILNTCNLRALLRIIRLVPSVYVTFGRFIPANSIINLRVAKRSFGRIDHFACNTCTNWDVHSLRVARVFRSGHRRSATRTLRVVGIVRTFCAASKPFEHHVHIRIVVCVNTCRGRRCCSIVPNEFEVRVEHTWRRASPVRVAVASFHQRTLDREKNKP